MIIDIGRAQTYGVQRLLGASRAVVAVGRFTRKNPLAGAGLVIIVVLVLASMLASQITLYGPLELNITDKLTGPSRSHWFGTDEFGRDVFSRCVYGLRVSITVAVVSVGISSVAGTMLGSMSAFYGGWVDLLVQRVVDMIMAFPTIILALAIVAVFGQSLNNVIIAIAIVQTPVMTRVVRASALAIRERAFVEAAEATGAGDTRVLLRHIVPNTVPVVLVVATAALGYAVLTEASLSFLGVGIPAPHPSLGSMLSGSAQQYAEQAPWLIIFPGVALAAFVFSANFLGDGLRDVLDPRMRGRR